MQILNFTAIYSWPIFFLFWCCCCWCCCCCWLVGCCFFWVVFFFFFSSAVFWIKLELGLALTLMPIHRFELRLGLCTVCHFLPLMSRLLTRHGSHTVSASARLKQVSQSRCKWRVLTANGCFTSWIKEVQKALTRYLYLIFTRLCKIAFLGQSNIFSPKYGTGKARNKGL